jgi:hypothetical protein
MDTTICGDKHFRQAGRSYLIRGESVRLSLLAHANPPDHLHSMMVSPKFIGANLKSRKKCCAKIIKSPSDGASTTPFRQFILGACVYFHCIIAACSQLAISH